MKHLLNLTYVALASLLVYCLANTVWNSLTSLQSAVVLLAFWSSVLLLRGITLNWLSQRRKFWEVARNCRRSHDTQLINALDPQTWQRIKNTLAKHRKDNQ